MNAKYAHVKQKCVLLLVGRWQLFSFWRASLSLRKCILFSCCESEKYWQASFSLIFALSLSVAVTRSRDVPSFGPPIPKGVTFPKSNVFRDFLLAKVINAENAAHKSEKFRAMATRTRQEYLKDLAEKNVTNTPIDPSGKFPFISLASKKKEKSKPYPGAELSSMGAIVWAVRAKDYNKAMEIDCLLGVSNEFIVLIEQETKSVVFNCSCRDVIGWTSTDTSLKIFYERGECVSVESFINNEDIKEIVKRLQVSVFLPLTYMHVPFIKLSVQARAKLQKLVLFY